LRSIILIDHAEGNARHGLPVGEAIRPASAPPRRALEASFSRVVTAFGYFAP
jgi:hypothetical protein